MSFAPLREQFATFFSPSKMTASRSVDTKPPAAYFFAKDNDLASRSGSVVDVRLQSASCNVPTRKGWGQTRNDAVQQLDHARFCRCGRTKRVGVPASRHSGCVRQGD